MEDEELEAETEGNLVEDSFSKAVLQVQVIHQSVVGGEFISI
jgi:hypothetical protein